MGAPKKVPLNLGNPHIQGDIGLLLVIDGGGLRLGFRVYVQDATFKCGLGHGLA